MSRRVLSYVAAFVVLATTPACLASRYKVDADAPTYAAKAKIAVKVNKTDNRQVSIRLNHLAPPTRIDAGYRGYAVWFRVPGHGTSKAGVLNYNDRRRRGTLVATTPHPKFEVIVTLERELSSPTAAGPVILRKIVAKS